MSSSILTDVKKALGLAEDDTSFDLDVTMHINSILSVLNQVGIGPNEGFLVEDSSATWEDFLGTDPRKNMAKSYIYARVRLLFDPPTTSYLIESLKTIATEFEYRLNVLREETEWTPATA